LLLARYASCFLSWSRSVKLFFDHFLGKNAARSSYQEVCYWIREHSQAEKHQRALMRGSIRRPRSCDVPTLRVMTLDCSAGSGVPEERPWRGQSVPLPTVDLVYPVVQAGFPGVQDNFRVDSAVVPPRDRHSLFLQDFTTEVHTLLADVDPGPAMSFLTCFWLLPQKEHLSKSPLSPSRATGGDRRRGLAAASVRAGR
jgi:hypothetical protein